MQIQTTEVFDRWRRKLRDSRAQYAISARIFRMSLGNLGDAKPVGGGVSEARIHIGAGYRIYFANRGGELIILLCGGDKSSQQEDIALAKKLNEEI